MREEFKARDEALNALRRKSREMKNEIDGIWTTHGRFIQRGTKSINFRFALDAFELYCYMLILTSQPQCRTSNFHKNRIIEKLEDFRTGGYSV